MCTSYSSCRGAGYSDYGYQKNQGTMYWRMYTGTNCTNYVAYRLVTTNGMPNTRPKSGVGNARDWGKAMSSITDSTPVVGSVAWWGRTGNHVAYVEKVVSSSEIIVSESNYGRAFDWRRITKGSGWPDGFIHFADPTLTNTAKPALSGSKRVGATLTASSGSWKPAASGTSYQWLLDGKAIKGATSASYKPLAAQIGHQLSAKITAIRSSYSKATATSTYVTVTKGLFAAAQQPKVVGTAQVDVPLTASAGTWTPAPTTTTYQWLADGVPVAGATSSTFTPGPELVGKAISTTVGVGRTGYTGSSATSARTAKVAAGAMSSTTAPTVTGTPRVDGTLKAAGGTWSQTGVTTAWQWLRDGKAITGATSTSYSPVLADRGTTLSVRATAAKPGYQSATRTVTAGKIGDGVFASPPKPRLSGAPRVSAPVQAEAGTWSP
ncbi:MAG: CHAP domain-containing protein, partial [Actinomycetales bacterium]